MRSDHMFKRVRVGDQPCWPHVFFTNASLCAFSSMTPFVAFYHMRLVIVTPHGQRSEWKAASIEHSVDITMTMSAGQIVSRAATGMALSEIELLHLVVDADALSVTKGWRPD